MAATPCRYTGRWQVSNLLTVSIHAQVVNFFSLGEETEFSKSGKKVEEGGMGEGKGLVIDKRYKLPKLKYHAYVDAVTGAVIKPEDLKKAIADKTASAAKQWVREAAKGEKGISEVDASTKKKTEKAKASAAAAAKSVKVPMSNKKVPIMIGVEETDGSTMTLLDHAKSVGEKVSEGASEASTEGGDRLRTPT